MMSSKEQKDRVSRAYAEKLEEPASCCEGACGQTSLGVGVFEGSATLSCWEGASASHCLGALEFRRSVTSSC